jgi:hypothetical protein
MSPKLHSLTKAFLNYGRIILESHPEQQDYLESLDSHVFADKGLEDKLRKDLELIVQEAMQAIEFLNQPQILNLSDEEDACEDALKAFDGLDRLVYLMEGADRLLSPRNEKLSAGILQSIRQSYDEISAFFSSSSFSALRLTVLQDCRSKALENIKPEHHYLFPWYDLFIDAEPDILHLIAEYSDQPEKMPEKIKADLPLFHAEIQKDEVLKNYIQKQSLTSRQFGKMLDTHWSLRLWGFVEQINLDKVLPEMVEQKGVAKLSRSLYQGPELNIHERFALGLSAALFAPDIAEAERLKLLEQCEKIFDRIKETPNPDNPAGRVIQRLNHFLQGRFSLQEAVQATLDYWIEQLNAVHAEDRDSKADMAGLVRSIISVEDLDETEKITYRPQRPSLSGGKDKSKPWLEKLKAWLGKPVVFVSALAALLIAVSVPLLFRQEDPMHINLEMLVYQAQPLTRSDEAETVITKESGLVLSSRDCFQLLFTPTRDIYAYLLHQDTGGKVTKYFEGQLYKDQTRVFPDEDSRACFTEDSGSEVFFLVYLDDAIDGFNELTYRLSKTDDLLDTDHFEQEIRAVFPNAKIEKFKFSYN